MEGPVVHWAGQLGMFWGWCWGQEEGYLGSAGSLLRLDTVVCTWAASLPVEEGKRRMTGWVWLERWAVRAKGRGRDTGCDGMWLERPIPHQTLASSSACGFSFEQDPTLRDPMAMARRWPWMVSVRANGTHICAGTLIASQWVLVVAHCLMKRNVAYSVLVGSPVMDEPAQHAHNVPVGQVIVNRRFRSRRYWSWVGRAHNIGLLRLQSTLKYNKYVWPICLPGLDFEMKDRSICTVTGWGLPRANGVWPQFRSIQEKEVTILNNMECDQYYHRFSKIPTMVRIINSRMICAEDTNRDNFCYEKTGEPLACAVESTWYLVGMVSWGPGCNKGDAPPIYLQISAYQQWISDCLKGQSPTLVAPSRALFLALPLPLRLLDTL
ncbi:probable threonine protease PRSS50 [Loxodonta africana]|uniref:probable threonine protease PRSS50 n=1 Tax=Loxodonta africana TaxID=9785 RepID=UPI000C8140B7|nr:probable threonine protease PRSS50 isoform X2 [Loxodonta africana]